LARLWADIAPSHDAIVLSGATGVGGPTEEEGSALDRLAPMAVRHALGDALGHPMEAVAPVAAAIAAGMVASGAASDVVATVVGHRRGEGLVRLAALG
jgi:3-oxoacyl-[acyl-carrier-protein] synthase II